MFSFVPKNENINLIYISLINNQIKQAIYSHDFYKKDKSRKVSNLGSDINSVVYSFNKLYSFCIQYNIEVFYYEPKKHLFYKKNQNNFEPSELNLSNENPKKLSYIFHFTKLLNHFQHNLNVNDSENIKKEYQDFLKKKRKKTFSYIIDEFDFGIVYEFAYNYFNNVEIDHYINLSKIHPDIEFKDLSKNQAIISLVLNEKNKYEIDSFIYNNYLIKCEGDNLKFIGKAYLIQDNDFLVVINFDSICESLKNLIKAKK